MAIKNTILMILIILIFHFLIKNYLFEASITQPRKIEVEKKQVEPSPPAPIATIPTVEKVLETKEDPEELRKKKEAELFEFVFNETVTPVLNNDSEGRALSPSTVQVVKAPPEPKLPPPQATRSQDEAFQNSAAQFATIKEYENEKIMNGGSLFEGISGYEPVGSDLSSLDAVFNASLTG